jgi:hypothetical protein
MVSYIGRFYGHNNNNNNIKMVNNFTYHDNIDNATFTNSLKPDNVKFLHFMDFVNAIVGYALWQIFYFWKTEVNDKTKLDNCPSKLTSLRWLSKDLKNPFVLYAVKIMRMIKVYKSDEVPDSNSIKTKLVYVFYQFIYTLCTFIPTYFLYQSQLFSLVYIGIIYTAAVFYGASYYIEIFSTRYQWQFKQVSSKHLVHQQLSTRRLSSSDIKYVPQSKDVTTNNVYHALGSVDTAEKSNKTREIITGEQVFGSFLLSNDSVENTNKNVEIDDEMDDWYSITDDSTSTREEELLVGDDLGIDS